MRPLWDSIVRTFTPIIVGAVVGWFAAQGIEIDPNFEPSLVAVISAGASGAYYLVVRIFETYVSPKFGWLLGLAKQPEYIKPE